MENRLRPVIAGKKEGVTDETCQLQIARFKKFHVSWTEYLQDLRQDTVRPVVAATAANALQISPPKASTDDYSESFTHLSPGVRYGADLQAALDAIH